MPSALWRFKNVQEWLQCSKLFLNVLRTHYMVFTPRKRVIDDVYVKNQDVQIQSVYVTKFLWVQIESQVTWKIHIEYTCKKLSKCVGMLCKARNNYINLPSSAYTIILNTLILSIATMYGENLPFLPWKNISNTKETYSNYNLLSISSP